MFFLYVFVLYYLFFLFCFASFLKNNNRFLGHNSLTGIIPSTIGELTKLTGL